MLSNAIAVANGKGGVGKCLDGSALVVDPTTGVPRRLDEVIRSHDHQKVLTFDGQSTRAADIAAKVDSGVQPTLRIELASGRSILVTPHHPLLLPDGWRRADQVAVGETIALAAHLPAPLDPRPLPDAEVDLLAVLLTEGGTSRPATRFSTASPAIVHTATQAARTLGINVRHIGRYDYVLTGGTPTPVVRGLCHCGCGRRTRVPARTVPSQGLIAGEPLRLLPHHGAHAVTTLRRLRLDHGLGHTLAKQKVMPSAVYRLPDEQLARFLAVFWMCDGHVDRLGRPQLTLASEPLVRAVQHLLLRFGVQSRIRSKSARLAGRSFPAWELSVYAASIPAFAARIRLWGSKQQRIAERASRIRATGGNPNVGQPSLTPELRARLHALCPGVGRKRAGQPRLDDVAQALGWTFGNRARFDTLLFNKPHAETGYRHVSLRSLRAYCEAFGGEEEFGWIYGGEVFWDPIVAITPAGDRQVYDLTVAATHNFIADDVIVHNTSIVANVGGLAALSGWRVLLVELDPQGNLGRDLGYHSRSDRGQALFTAVQAYFQGHRDDRGHLLSSHLPTPLREVRSRLDVLPGGLYLDDLIAILDRHASRDPEALRVLDPVLAPLASAYNLLLLDCPPSRGTMQNAALASAHYLVVPTTYDEGSLDGLSLMAQATQQAHVRNPGLELLGVVLFDFAVQATTVLAEVLQDLTRDLGDLAPVWQPPIRTAPKAAFQTRKFGLLAHEYELYAMGALNRPNDGMAAAGREPMIDEAILNEVGLVPQLEDGRIRRFSGAAGTLAAEYQTLTTQLLEAFAEGSASERAAGGKRP
jgi:chromosome partitioning protein